MRNWVLAALLVSIPGAAGAQDRWAEIRKAGVLRVLAGADSDAGLFNLGAGEPGFERELLEGFASLHKVRLEPVPVQDFATILDRLVAGEGDLVIGLIDTSERRRRIDFTVENMPARHLCLNYRPALPLATVEQLRQEKVGTVKGTSWWSTAVEAGLAESRLVPMKDRVEVVEALRTGRITATVMSLSDATLAMKRDPRLQAGVFLGKPMASAWGVRKSDPSLRAALDEYLGRVRLTTTWSRLVVKYFGEEALAVVKRAAEQ